MARIKVGKVKDITPGNMIGSQVEDTDILIANIDGKFYAMRSKCNHMGGPLHRGKLEGKVVTCPWHGSKWDVTSGKLASFYTPLPPEPTYKVVIEGEDLFVES